MSILTSHSFLKNKLIRILTILIVCWMAAYPIYNNYYKGLAVEQYERFLDFKAGKSMFFNPWQYRILCPLIIEGTFQILDATVFKVIPESKSEIELQGKAEDKNENIQKLIRLSKNSEFIKYSIVFIGFRFVQNLIILWLSFLFISHFVKTRSLVILGLMLITLFMGNAVMDSDLAFNSYMDVILYLAAGLVIVKKYSGWWIAVLTLIGAFNRETSLLIPVIYFVSEFNWLHWKKPIAALLENKKIISIAGVSVIAFVIVFVSIRFYYGYQPQTEWRVPAGLPMLKLNLLSAASVKTYNEMFGVFGILPFWFVLIIKRVPKVLLLFFIALVPVWFGVHLISVVAYQSRLFLVPTLLIFLPGVLYFIENEFRIGLSSETN
ncbi:MAG: hypothetical protein KF856_12145 [Cyclobacteriaceae bacterium]|nr:hypothetical protein [Cyclobacteriaceae bacterium]